MTQASECAGAQIGVPEPRGLDGDRPPGRRQQENRGLEIGDTSRLDELRLVRQAQAGDMRAFEQLYRDTVGRVYGLCLRMCGEAWLAEELAQDAFVRAWDRLDSFRADSAFSSWVYRIAVNVVLTEHRAKTRRNAKHAEAEDNTGRHHGAAPRTPELRMDLEAAIATLPDGAREVFLLHDVEGYKHEEISELTGIAPGTSKAQLFRARRLLREALAL
ncbi:MAG: hypothetical protein AMXMBFR84_25480 [Candidatus Hydrogenedentota bacterium]